MMAPRIKVLLVEPCPAERERLAELLRADSRIEVPGAVENGAAALDLLSRERPDVALIDINLPQRRSADNLSAFALTRRIMETRPLPVIIVSPGWKPDEVETAFAAMQAGAVAVVAKPEPANRFEYVEAARKLVDTVKAMSEVRVVRRWPRAAQAQGAQGASRATPPGVARPVRPGIVAIGASTGGPLVLQTILSRLDRNFELPIVITQHISPGFLSGMISWLARSTSLTLHVAEHDQSILPGHVYFAPDGRHMGVAGDGRIVLCRDCPEHGECPSVSHLFASVARAYGARSVGVLLTGMGRDGAQQLRQLKDLGAITLVQDRESCVVNGMPGQAIALGAATQVLSPEGIASFLTALQIGR